MHLLISMRHRSGNESHDLSLMQTTFKTYCLESTIPDSIEIDRELRSCSGTGTGTGLATAHHGQ